MRSADSEQLAVVAFRERGGVAHQTDHEGARGRNLPFGRRESGSICAPQLDRDLAIGRAPFAQVQRPEHQVEARQPIGGERPAARQRPRCPAEQATVEAQQAGDAGKEVFVERDDGGKRPPRRCLAQPQPMFAGRIRHNNMASVDPGQICEQRAERARIDRGCGLESLRRGVENDRDGGQVWAPDDRF